MRASVLLCAVLLGCVTVLSSALLAGAQHSPMPYLGLCRDFPNARSHTLGSWTCDTPAGEPDETMTCNFPMTDVALVIPFYWEEVPILERTLKGWSHPDSFPCTPNEESANHVDLILLLTSSVSSPDRFTTLQNQLRPLLTKTEMCFREVRIRMADQLVQASVVPSARSVFFALFGDERGMVNRYSYFMWMDPSTRPVQKGWVTALLADVVQEYKEMWQKGPIAYYMFKSDLHMNWNAWYKLGDREFNCVLNKAWEAQSPNSARLGIFEALALPENRWFLHKSLKTEMIVQASWRYYRELHKDFPNTYFLFGNNAWADVDAGGSQYGKFEGVEFKARS